MGWQDLIGNVSYVLLTVSYIVTNMLALRLLAIAALAFEGLYFYVASATPLWVGIIWSVVFVLINVLQAIMLLQRRRLVSLDQQQRDLRAWLAPRLDEAGFLALFKTSLPVVFSPGQELCRQGEPVTSLFVIVSGTLVVTIDGREVRRIGRGSLVGEVSFFIDDVATATVRADDEVTARVMPKASLRELCAHREDIRNAVNESITRSMAGRMASAAAA